MENTRYKVLLIEDNQIEQRMFQRFVESNAIPYECLYVGSVADARRVLDSEEFDIVISDHDLGDGTAFDILELTGETPIIVVTGAGDEAFIRELFPDRELLGVIPYSEEIRSGDRDGRSVLDGLSSGMIERFEEILKGLGEGAG